MPGQPSRLVGLRRVAAGVLVFVGIFVLCFGFGSGDRPVLLTGGAIIVLAFSARVASRFSRGPRQWLVGTAEVVEVSHPPADAELGRCVLQLVINAAGLPTQNVTLTEPRLPVGRWPRPGDELPVEVDARNVRNVRVLWRDTAATPAAVAPAMAGIEAWAAAPTTDQTWGGGTADEEVGDVTGPDYPDLDDLDFDLDGPATGEPAPEPTPEPVAGAAVPRPRPSPRPRSRPAPEPAAPAAAAGAPNLPGGPAGMPIDGVGVTLLVTDLARSVGFYRDRLGFQEIDGGDDTAVLASGRTRLVLRVAPGHGTVNRRQVYLNLEVTDIDAMYAVLRSGGVRFTYPPRPASETARLSLWAAAFRDPDGHGVAITQWRPREAAAERR